MITGHLKDTLPHFRGEMAGDPQLSGAVGDLALRGQRVWNRFGGLLRWVGSMAGVDPLLAAAVLAVESGGRGFEQHPDGQERMVIRFEVHHFWRHWGRLSGNRAEFSDCFRFDSESQWRGHQWRPTSFDEWRSVHPRQGQQVREWEVFEAAALTDREAALKSISMGLPQILGSNYRMIGYSDVEAIWSAFSESEAVQVVGFFDFLLARGVAGALQRGDLLEVATVYNGPGRAVRYAEEIEGVWGWLTRAHQLNAAYGPARQETNEALSASFRCQKVSCR